VYEALNRRDPEPTLQLLDPAVDFEVGTEGRLRGLEQVAHFLRSLPSSFASLTYEVEEVREAASSVIVLVRSSARGRTSGITTDARTAHLWTFADDRVIQFRVYPERSEGLDAFEASREQSRIRGL
jgi:ketosteroid isomerase-like protein